MAGDPRQTPAMQQYFRFKEAHPGCVLLFRMGDFYEVFDQDAVTLSKALGITLTSRNNGGSDVELAGFPHHALDMYLPRLVRAGFRVAICEQMEKPVPGKVVRRSVTEVVTPGVTTDDALLDAMLEKLAAERDEIGAPLVRRVEDRAVLRRQGWWLAHREPRGIARGLFDRGRRNDRCIGDREFDVGRMASTVSERGRTRARS